jgi:sulfatase modifying factor 1
VKSLGRGPRLALGLGLLVALAAVGALLGRGMLEAAAPPPPLHPALPTPVEPGPSRGGAAGAGPSSSSPSSEAFLELSEELADATIETRPIPTQREDLLEGLGRYFALEPRTQARLAEIFAQSRYLGQGIPKVTVHPMSRAACQKVRAPLRIADDGPGLCGERNMVPLYGHGQRADTSTVCIDRFEFPNIPCEYPVTWVRSSEALEICQALGKRLCDAHEWEGACAGDLRSMEEEYFFDRPRLQAEYAANQARKLVWSYGPTKNHALCATGSSKSPGCTASGPQCGSNTYPAGAMPECRSPFGVYDLHGNAAEHMNLPLGPEQLTRLGGSGRTEMKGSWFIFGQFEAHPDDCRFRAPNWHGSRVADPNSHANYHLGFRCCKDRPRHPGE